MNTSQPPTVQVTFKNLDRSDAVEAKVREKVEKLRSFYTPIMSCRVAVEELHRRHQQGNHFHVRIDLTVPGHELIADREPDENHAYSDVYVALRDAFDAMRRKLEDLSRLQQGKVKTHTPQPHGRVVTIAANGQSACIETPEGRRLYLHPHSLIDGDFDQLEVGMEVRFTEEMGEEGPQATSVYLVGKHHIVG